MFINSEPIKKQKTRTFNMITEDYVSFETAKLLKEKGFDWDCKQVYDLVRPQSCADGKMYDNFPNENPNAYDELVSAPTLQMAMKWLREKGFHVYSPMEIDYDEDERGDKWYHDAAYCPEIRRVSDGKIMYDDGTLYATPEQACEVAIRYCLENLI